jgi:hypothetical protein
MGQGIVNSEIDNSGKRECPHISDMPVSFEKLAAVYTARKYVDATGKYSNGTIRTAMDFAPVILTVGQTNNPAKSVSSVLGDKEALLFRTTAPVSKSLQATWDLAVNKYTIGFIFSNHPNIAVNVTRRLFNFAYTDGTALAFESSHTSSKMRVITPGAITTELTGTAGAAVNSTRIVVHIVFDANKYKVYINGVLNVELTGYASRELKGVCTLGSAGSGTSPFFGYFNYPKLHCYAMTDAQVLAEANQMVAAHTA